MTSANESTPMPPSQPVFSLPPPSSYEDLYSSYQNEWDQQKKIKNHFNKEFGTITSDIDESVSGLKWVVLPGDSGDDVYLLACTSSGEILVWKMAQSTEDGTNGATDSNNNPDPAVLLKRHARCRMCLDSEKNGCDDDDDDRDSNALHGICVVKLAATANGDAGKSKQKGRKRQRPNNGDEKYQQQVLLIVAGEGGLWSIPLLDVLKQPWETSSQELPSSLLRLSNRPVQKVQTSSSESEELQLLFVSERDTNTLVIWNLHVISEAHGTKSSDTICPTFETKMDLSRIFSGASACTLSKSKKRRRIRTGMDCSEHATAITVIPSLDDRSDGLTLLVGTDRSHLWIIPFPSGDDKATEQKAYCLSLHDEKKNSSEETRGFSGRQTASTEWSVTGVVSTNGGTWWTVAAAVAQKGCNKDNTGVLMTWHAPTGMVVARQETREAIQAILQDGQLYSAANERAITMWDSSFGLKRSGRFWASPPSSKALAILSRNSETKSVMAVGGVGDKIDLFVDHCRVQTMRI